MTTTVRVMIEGNRSCEVCIAEPQRPDGPVAVVKPGAFVAVSIYGAQYVKVKESGVFT